jgi:lipoprotein NlpD
MNMLRLILVLLPILGGCANHAPAPVIDRTSVPASPKNTVTADAGSTDGTYVVKKGDTLYGIALDHGQDYKDIAVWNNLDNPNHIQVGQSLRVTPPGGTPVAVAKPVTSSAPIEVKAAPLGAGANGDAVKHAPVGGKVPYSDEALARMRQESLPKPAAGEPKSAEKAAEKQVLASDEIEWVWPASGKLLTPFTEGGNKGIDLAGKAGDPVLAAAAGVVSYAGAGLRGYGNLVVLRHNATWLSVYAHNSKILVKEKQTVARGQKIAEIGSSDTESPRLHFEIRRQGKPVDPQKFLPSR